VLGRLRAALSQLQLLPFDRRLERAIEAARNFHSFGGLSARDKHDEDDSERCHGDEGEDHLTILQTINCKLWTASPGIAGTLVNIWRSQSRRSEVARDVRKLTTRGVGRVYIGQCDQWSTQQVPDDIISADAPVFGGADHRRLRQCNLRLTAGGRRSAVR
jgi:hypothetical protein